MRSKLLPFVAVAFMVACADGATSPLLQPGGPHLADNPPPPWAEVRGDVSTDGGGTAAASILPLFSRSAPGRPSASHTAAGNAGTFRGWLLVSPGGHASILRFAEGGTNVTFSNGAMIMKVNGKVSGRGTMTVGDHSYDLSLVDNFEANGDCATTPGGGPSCTSFSDDGGAFRSEASVWTGILSNSGGRKGPPSDCGKECVIICPDGECYISDRDGGKR